MIKNIEFEWNEKQKEQELNIKGRKMEVLAILRDAGGPFVSFKKVRWVLHGSHEE